jgi:C1A family cysteine protease
MNKFLIIALAATVLIGATTFLMMNQPKNIDTSSYPAEVIESFKAWSTKFGRKYSEPDFAAYRLGVFYQNYQTIANHPATATYTLGQNQFMDLTNEEFKATYLGLMPKKSVATEVFSEESEVLASSINWNTKGKVTGVKDQGQCGSCWAFSTTGSLESTDAIFGSEGSSLATFSEQQLVDCSQSYGNMGCNGGLMDYAF